MEAATILFLTALARIDFDDTFWCQLKSAFPASEEASSPESYAENLKVKYKFVNNWVCIIVSTASLLSSFGAVHTEHNIVFKNSLGSVLFFC